MLPPCVNAGCWLLLRVETSFGFFRRSARRSTSWRAPWRFCGRCWWRGFEPRVAARVRCHCEERSDEAIQLDRDECVSLVGHGTLCAPRDDKRREGEC